MYFALQFEKEFLFSAILSFLAQQLCFPKAPTKMDFIRSFFLGTEKISLTSFPSDCQLLSAKWGTPLSQRLTNSLLHWPVQQATYLQRESLKQLCHHLAGQSYSEFEWLAIWFFFFFSFSFCLSLISPWFINNCSAVKKQSINCSQRKVKLSKEPLSFAVYLFFPLEPVLADEMRQAGGQAAPLPCPPLPLDGGWPGGSGAALIYVSWEPGPVHPSPWQHCRLAPHLVVF